MSVGMSMPSPRDAEKLHHLSPWRVVIVTSFLLGRLKPRPLARTLELVRRGAIPATADLAESCYRSVVSSSPRCAGWRGCLPRSIAVALMCRFRGQWPMWCAGVRVAPPFAAHAWVEVEGIVVGEGVSASTYTPLVRIGPSRPGTERLHEYDQSRW